ncbi:TOTE conflict system archaeo-eukaryotic primase domain-containing protein [Cupriavidus necator]|uniref:TOTE conflict system archaeo-eukaryotic primase domain-containing protein n=1 Tax=Cupriavidus necator TaxID=106590 RepID=UPI0039C083F2
MQKHPHEHGCSVFVDADLHPSPDQWAFLASIRPMTLHDIEPMIFRATGGVHQYYLHRREGFAHAVDAPSSRGREAHRHDT